MSHFVEQDGLTAARLRPVIPMPYDLVKRAGMILCEDNESLFSHFVNDFRKNCSCHPSRLMLFFSYVHGPGERPDL